MKATLECITASCVFGLWSLEGEVDNQRRARARWCAFRYERKACSDTVACEIVERRLTTQSAG
jgi:hypothetical protein